MITKSKIIEYLTKNSDKLNIRLDVSNNKIYSKSGTFICNIDDYVETYKLNMGCSFTSIYCNHALLINVLKCNKCGTVIITREDEDYDPNLKCPTCTDYKSYFSYYTKEEIESNDSLKQMIDSYIRMSNFEKEAYEYEQKHGHPYWQIFKKKIYTKNHMYKIELKCDDVRKSRFKGLYLDITSFEKGMEQGEYRFSNNLIIPLSFDRIYIQWIYPHLGKCHKDFRSKWYIGKAREDKENDK